VVRPLEWCPLPRPPAVLYPPTLGPKIEAWLAAHLGSADQVKFRCLAHKLRAIMALAAR
jgi:hypothetical protein